MIAVIPVIAVRLVFKVSPSGASDASVYSVVSDCGDSSVASDCSDNSVASEY